MQIYIRCGPDFNRGERSTIWHTIVNRYFDYAEIGYKKVDWKLSVFQLFHNRDLRHEKVEY